MNSPLNKHQIILRPVFSEKSSRMTALDLYTFRVEPNTTKHQIKLALKELYNVDVIKITTTRRKGQVGRSMRTGKYFSTSSTKKATVQLKKGQKLELFNAVEQ